MDSPSGGLRVSDIDTLSQIRDLPSPRQEAAYIITAPISGAALAVAARSEEARRVTDASGEDCADCRRNEDEWRAKSPNRHT